jgi:hypothetical protein
MWLSVINQAFVGSEWPLLDYFSALISDLNIQDYPGLSGECYIASL